MHELYTVQQIIDAFTPGNPEFVGILIAFCIANAIGLLEYIWAVAINVKERKTPFPVWAHTFFFAHDFTAGVVFVTLAIQNDFFWMFTIYGLGMLTWTCLEAINMRTIVKYEREEVIGEGGTEGQMVLYLVLQIAVMFGIVNMLRWNMNDVAMFCWLPLTNVVMAIAPGYVLYKRKSREGSSMFIYIMVVVGTIFNFLPAPIGLFSSVLPWIYNQPIWFAFGAACTIVAVFNLYRFSKLPAKTKEMGDYKNKPIW